MKLCLEIEAGEKLREFEIEKIIIKAERGTQKDVEITAIRPGIVQNFDLLYIFNRYDSTIGDTFII